MASCTARRWTGWRPGVTSAWADWAWHRKGQYRSMTLKLREYMARGLPFVYAVDDPSLPEDPAVCLRLAQRRKPH